MIIHTSNCTATKNKNTKECLGKVDFIMYYTGRALRRKQEREAKKTK